MIEAIFHFPTRGTPVRCTPIGTGHIHHTFCVETDLGERYILQRLNSFVFPDADAIMDAPFTVVTPDSRNPYKQLYVAN